MSLILDALRKMEQDRRSRPGPAAALRPDVLRYRARTAKRRRSKPYLLMAAGVVCLAGGIAAGTFALGRYHAAPVAAEPAAATASLPTAATAAVPAAEPSVAATSAALPEPPAPAATAKIPTGTAAATPPAATPRRPKALSRASAPAVSAPPVSAADASPAAEPIPARVKRARLAQAKPERHESAEPMQGNPQDITISGIAWQEERNLRRAVLNGSLVAEGAQVAGARVVEIKEDRVRLSRGGQTFEVVFSSALSSR